MRYSYEISRHLERDLEKIQKKDKERFEILLNKMSGILGNPHRFKPKAWYERFETGSY